MPKQRGGWKGRDKDVPSKKGKASDDDDDMYEPVDKYHNNLKLVGEDDVSDDDEDAYNVEPVLDLKSAGASDDDEDDEDDDDVEEEEDDDEDEEEEEDDEDDEEDDTTPANARSRDEKLLNKWGSKRSSFYNTDAEVEVDEEAAAAEETEALRLQRRRAAAIDDEDASFGVSLAAASAAGAGPRSSVAGGKTSTSSGKSSSPLSGAAQVLGGRSSSSAAGGGGGGVERLQKDLTTLSRDAKLQALMADAPELMGLLEELRESSEEVRGTLAPILKAVGEGRVNTSGGLAYAEARYHVLLDYVSNITFYLLLKAEGKPVRGHPVVMALVNSKALLDKMRPLDAKMAGTMARLVAAAARKEGGGSGGGAKGTSGRANSSEDDAEGDEVDDDDDDDDDDGDRKGKGTSAADRRNKRLAAAMGSSSASASLLRPNPSAMGFKKTGPTSSSATSSSSSSKSGGASAAAQRGSAGGKSSSQSDLDAAIAALEGVTEEGHDAEITGGIYRPLKRASHLYDDAPAGSSAKRDKEEARRKARLARSGALADLRSAYSEAPEEAGVDGLADPSRDEGGRLEDEALQAKERERQEYEEGAFTRVAVSKEEKKARKAREKQRARWENLAEFEQYGDLDRLLEEHDAAGPSFGAKRGGRSLAELEEEVEHAKKRSAAGVLSSSSSGFLGASAGSLKRGRASGQLGGGGGDDEDGGSFGGDGNGDDDNEDLDADALAYYDKAAASTSKKRARKETVRHDADRATSDHIKYRGEEEDLHDSEGHRKASKLILQNRGLVKYRSKDEKNPRVHYRKKADKALKRRQGQVVSMRDSAKEAGAYGGEKTGIRTNISRSRIIKS